MLPCTVRSTGPGQTAVQAPLAVSITSRHWPGTPSPHSRGQRPRASRLDSLHCGLPRQAWSSVRQAAALAEHRVHGAADFATAAVFCRLRAAQVETLLFNKKVTETVVEVAEHTRAVHLCAPAPAVPPATRTLPPSCATWWSAGGACRCFSVSALTERMHTAMQIPPRNQRNSFLHIPKTGCHCL